jgi:allophanate hydrolase subunit 2
LRAYVGVRGGVAAAHELGSASTDLLSHLGPPPLADGDVLATADAVLSDPVVDHAPEPALPHDPVLKVRLGPGPTTSPHRGRHPARHLLDGVAAQRPRRPAAHGPTLDRAEAEELASEPTVRGAVQVPSDGRPVVFGPDHPRRAATVVAVDARLLDALAQLRPGDTVRFAATH